LELDIIARLRLGRKGGLEAFDCKAQPQACEIHDRITYILTRFAANEGHRLEVICTSLGPRGGRWQCGLLRRWPVGFLPRFHFKMTVPLWTNFPVHKVLAKIQAGSLSLKGPGTRNYDSSLVDICPTCSLSLVTIGVLTTGPRLQNACNDTFLQPNYYTYSNSDHGST
jgi:hypothetical protein